MKDSIKQIVLDACKDPVSMRDAALKTGIKYTSFIRYAKLLGCNKPNQGRKGLKQTWKTGIPLSEILEGKHQNMSSGNIRRRIFKEEIKEKKCERCGITQWQDRTIMFDMHHIDGNSHNHRIDNLEILCPNCHSQTDTFKFKKRR